MDRIDESQFVTHYYTTRYTPVCHGLLAWMRYHWLELEVVKTPEDPNDYINLRLLNTQRRLGEWIT